MCSENNKTPDQIRAEMIAKMQQDQATPQYLSEVATPGVIRNVDFEDAEK